MNDSPSPDDSADRDPLPEEVREYADDEPSLWQENHGNLLAFFTLAIIVCGSGVLACKQMQFVPARFPSGDAIKQLEDAPGDVGGVARQPGSPTATESDQESDQESEQPGQSSAIPAADDGSVRQLSDKVIIRVRGADGDQGTILLAFYDSATGFNDRETAFKLAKLDIKSGSASHAVAMEDLPERFAVAAFHDKNEDVQLNRSTFGIPTERYGFSNGARSLTGPPSFDQAVISRQAGANITISLK